MQACVRSLLTGVGEDADREGLKDTPKRVAKAFMDMMEGYRIPLASALGTALFNEPIVSRGSGGLVLVRDIDFASTSEATLLPFHGRCHIAYVPSNGVVLGLSKLARLTKLAARRVQTQETLAQRVLHALCDALRPQGVAVIIHARHLSYATTAPLERLTAAVAGSCAGSSSGSSTGELLAEVLAMLDVDPDELAAAGRPLQLLEASSHHKKVQQQHSGSGVGARSSMQRTASSSGSDSPMAPVTPDPSEHDDEALSAGFCEGASYEGASEAGGASSLACSSCDDGDAAAEGMEAAVATLLAESGVHDVASPALQAGVRRYVMSLLASTSGYHQEAPLALPRLQVGCGCTCAADGQPQQYRRRQQQQQQQQQHEQQHEQQEQQEQRACSAVVPPPSAAVASATSTWREHHVRFVSQCEHHMLPFYGSVHIAYIPACHGCEAYEGMSHDQAEQVVAAYTQRLQVQERITQQVADAVSALTGASGVVVAVRAAHMCMVARGVENHAGSTITRTASGEFELRPELRARFLRAVALRSEASACGSAPGATCGCGC